MIWYRPLCYCLKVDRERLLNSSRDRIELLMICDLVTWTNCDMRSL
jgi:hypothetical protein